MQIDAAEHVASTGSSRFESEGDRLSGMESLAGDGDLAGERALFHGLYVRSNPAYGAAADASVLSVTDPAT
jgi:hypothetical protein